MSCNLVFFQSAKYLHSNFVSQPDFWCVYSRLEVCNYGLLGPIACLLDDRDLMPVKSLSQSAVNNKCSLDGPM